MYKTINDITIEEVNEAAASNSRRYIDRAMSIAQQAFIEGVMWAQKVHRDKRLPLDLENTEFDYGHNVTHKMEGDV